MIATIITTNGKGESSKLLEQKKWCEVGKEMYILRYMNVKTTPACNPIGAERFCV
jgi:hypothetical protein